MMNPTKVPAWLTSSVMNVRRFMLKPGLASVVGSHVHGNRLRVKTRYTMATPGVFDPATEDTEVQVSDGQGQIFCQVVPAKYWKFSSPVTSNASRRRSCIRLRAPA